jgi:hypothetical protein
MSECEKEWWKLPTIVKMIILEKLNHTWNENLHSTGSIVYNMYSKTGLNVRAVSPVDCALLFRSIVCWKEAMMTQFLVVLLLSLSLSRSQTTYPIIALPLCFVGFTKRIVIWYSTLSSTVLSRSLFPSLFYSRRF